MLQARSEVSAIEPLPCISESLSQITIWFWAPWSSADLSPWPSLLGPIESESSLANTSFLFASVFLSTSILSVSCSVPSAHLYKRDYKGRGFCSRYFLVFKRSTDWNLTDFEVCWAWIFKAFKLLWKAPFFVKLLLFLAGPDWLEGWTDPT